MAKLYTKTGDKGETSLVSGSRVSKDDERIYLYGEVDELNSFLGLLHYKLSNEEDKKLVHSLQNNLFNLGSRLACESESWEKYKLPGVDEEVIKNIELRIDEIDGKLPKLSNFILPGGTEVSAVANICRSITRRVERSLVKFRKIDNLPQNSMILLNRVSDYLFILGRYENKLASIHDIPWIK